MNEAMPRSIGEAFFVDNVTTDSKQRTRPLTFVKRPAEKNLVKSL